MEKRVLIWDDGLSYVNYMEALREVGLTPVVGREAAGPCAALLLPGGGDIADRLPEDEIRTIRAYAAAEKPILGICRGMQALNVFSAGHCMHVCRDTRSRRAIFCMIHGRWVNWRSWWVPRRGSTATTTRLSAAWGGGWVCGSGRRMA